MFYIYIYVLCFIHVLYIYTCIYIYNMFYIYCICWFYYIILKYYKRNIHKTCFIDVLYIYICFMFYTCFIYIYTCIYITCFIYIHILHLLVLLHKFKNHFISFIVMFHFFDRYRLLSCIFQKSPKPIYNVIICEIPPILQYIITIKL